MANAPASGTPPQTAPTTDPIFNGARYLASLQDAREIYIYGERVRDVTQHPGFRNACRSIARLYDALHDPKYRDTLTGPDRVGTRTHKFFKQSYSEQEFREALHGPHAGL